ncbi:phosphoenolpyruvate-protein phosphotransferase [Vibrio sp. qd031]|uniref:phosphoenolpyruvate--protein phosphotransferase n=1 Tax=Vibrio sp. qd031 TaxID=1603038 RepID=UPI000A1025C0|nr:phosphoenolpyruvate--protein phosphotransferase [Vibrio sp. qd031]ORT52081.1 phosphoenolpyruvate-protein phosphotransferase [Vibrio sp. qd031]
MTGIVVVSHSRRLAEGVAELATQMTQGKANIAIAAGIDDPENPIGTDAIAVMGAIEEVCDDDGVVVLMDLGSALLSTEMAIELIDPDIAEKVKLVSAPVVEGTLAASVAAAAGLDIDTVISEAKAALGVKQEHLGETDDSVAPEVAVQSASDALSFEWQVENPHGIHARPAASIVGAVAAFNCDMWLIKGDKEVSAKSLNSIAKLAVSKGESICFKASGDNAQGAIDAFKQLAHTHFGEADLVNNPQPEPETEQVASAPSHQAIKGAITGLSVNGGIVTGPAVLFSASMPDVPNRSCASIADEQSHFTQSIETVSASLKQQASEPHGEIFQAHLLMLNDPELLASVQTRIAQNVIAEQAWVEVTQQLALEYSQAESTYMQEREADVHDIACQVMRVMTGDTDAGIALSEPSILLARDLMPSDVAGLDKNLVLAICLSEGGKTSHSAILARAMGIPAIVQAKGCLEEIQAGQYISVDGFSGLLWHSPDSDTSAELEQKRQQWLAECEAAKANAQSQAATLDGQKVQSLANIGGPEDVQAALDNGAEGVGLFRTEFLFQSRDTLPSEDEQTEVYLGIAKAFGDKPITIRSLDVGGDKPLKAYPMPEEENPFLGLRGVRLCLAHKDLFVDQIRAVLRAHAQQPNIQLMIPMIATVDEIHQVKALVEEQKLALGLQESNLPVGIMIEVPAAVLNADALAKEVDFFSIGTNDLTQYVMAADRGNTDVATLVNYFEPAVLSAIELTCKAAKNAGIAVSMCGEMAGDTKATETLLKLGLTKFSASSTLLPALKQTVRGISLSTTETV